MEDRIEVELTPIDEPRQRRHRRGATPAASPTPDPIESTPPEEADDGVVTVGPDPVDDRRPSDRWFGTERGRVVTAAVVAATVALLLGWMLGRAGSGGEPAIDAGRTTSTAVEDEEPSATERVEGQPIPPVRTTRPRRTTTTTILEIETASLAVDDRLAGAPIELVGLGSGRLVEADLGTGTSRTIPVDALWGTTDQLLRVGPDWVLISRFDGPSSRLVLADGSVEGAALGEPWSTLWEPGTDRFWRLEQDWWAGPAQFVGVTLDGTATGEELEIPLGSGSWLADPAGGILATVAGGLYSVDVDGVDFIGRGDLIALGTTSAVLRACDDELECGLAVVDRSTGDARALLAVDDAGDEVTIESSAYFGPFSTTPVSPDGRWATVILLDTPTPRVGLLDLETGRVTELTRADYGIAGVQAVFSSDSRHLFYLDATTPHAVDLATGEHFPVFTEPVSWTAFGFRDAPPDQGVAG